jgi:hypothetical protein
MNLKKIIKNAIGTISLSAALISGDNQTDKIKADLALSIYGLGQLNEIKLETELVNSCLDMYIIELGKISCFDAYIDFSNENASQQVEECIDSIDVKVQSYNTQIDSIGKNLLKNQELIQKYGEILNLDAKRSISALYSQKENFCDQYFK